MPVTPKKDSRAGQVARVATSAGIGGLAGRIAAWHPVHGGRMNRGTLIGAGIGAAAQLGAERLSKRFEGDDQRVVRKAGITAATIGVYGATLKAGKAGAADDREAAFADLKTQRTGKVSEKEAMRQNAKARRAMGAEGETFIPKMPRFARETAKRAGFRSIVTEDQTGGTIEDKLARLYKSAKGTPEGDAALNKLNSLRKKQGKTVTERAKKMITKITSRFAPKKVSKFAGHLLSAREELQSIIELGLPRYPVKKSTAIVKGDLELLRKSNQERLRKIPKKEKLKPTNETNLDDRSKVIEFDRERIRGAVKVGAVGAAAGSVLGGLIGRRYGLGKIAALNYGLRGAATGAVVGAVTARKKKITFREQLQEIVELKEIDLGRTYENYAGCGESVSPRKKSFPSLYISDRAEDIDLPLEGKATVRYKLRSKTIRQDDAGKKKHSADIEIQSIDPIDEIKNQLIGGKSIKLMSARDRLDNIIEFERGPALAGAGVKEALAALARRRANFGAGRVIARKAIAPIPTVGTLIGKKTGVPAKGWYKERSSESFTSKSKSIIELRDHDGLAETAIVGGAVYGKSISPRDHLNAIIQLADPRPRNDLGMFTDQEEGAPNPNQIDSVYKQTRRSVGQNLAGGAVAGVGAAASGGAIKALVNKLRKVRA